MQIRKHPGSLPVISCTSALNDTDNQRLSLGSCIWNGEPAENFHLVLRQKQPLTWDLRWGIQHLCSKRRDGDSRQLCAHSRHKMRIIVKQYTWDSTPQLHPDLVIFLNVIEPDRLTQTGHRALSSVVNNAKTGNRLKQQKAAVKNSCQLQQRQYNSLSQGGKSVFLLETKRKKEIYYLASDLLVFVFEVLISCRVQLDRFHHWSNWFSEH